MSCLLFNLHCQTWKRLDWACVIYKCDTVIVKYRPHHNNLPMTQDPPPPTPSSTQPHPLLEHLPATTLHKPAPANVIFSPCEDAQSNLHSFRKLALLRLPAAGGRMCVCVKAGQMPIDPGPGSGGCSRKWPTRAITAVSAPPAPQMSSECGRKWDDGGQSGGLTLSSLTHSLTTGPVMAQATQRLAPWVTGPTSWPRH